jgi:deazaflavin-dependent oxidoreductase (nitroreductase family)
MGLTDSLQSGFLRFHQVVYEVTRGSVGHRMIGVPSLLMTSVGRRTGKSRTAALVYAKDDAAYVVVASNGGADAPPGWLHNVKATPSVEVQVGRKRFGAIAEVVEAGDARYAELWKRVNAMNHGRYDRYQSKTTRSIALVRLTPA